MMKALLLLAQGFEEIEALAPFDILKRGGCEVTLAAVSPSSDTSLKVTGGQGLCVLADGLLSEHSTQDYEALILPGGSKGASNLQASPDVTDAIRQFKSSNRLIGAICASPAVVLGAIPGVLDGLRFTCYPGLETQAKEGHYTASRVEVDGCLITASGAGASLEFGFALLSALSQPDNARRVQQSMQAH